MTRTNTPDRLNKDGSTTITSKRACNGCGEYVGDVTVHEVNAAIAGRPMPDVRRECANCAPTAPEPACIPTRVVAGDTLCVTRDCDHEVDDADEYCDVVREEVICATHSEFKTSPQDDFESVTVSAPWPCKTLKAVA